MLILLIDVCPLVLVDPPIFGEYFVMADKLRINEVIDNLISNAIKFSPIGETIEIGLEKYDDNYGNGKLKFSVKDNGPGLTDNDKKKIFGKFERLSAQPTAGESSSGLGLSIVKQLVELHDGRIWVDSIHGQGAEFIIELSL